MNQTVRNASDKQQVRAAERAEKQKQSDLRVVLSTTVGRRVFTRLLNELQPRDQNMWHPSAIVNLNAVKHDFGNWLKNEIEAADPRALLNMFQEECGERIQESIDQDKNAPKKEEQEE